MVSWADISILGILLDKQHILYEVVNLNKLREGSKTKKHGIDHYLFAFALTPLSWIEQKETHRKLEERYKHAQTKQTYKKDPNSV